MCRATQKAACRVPVTCRCVTGVRPHTRHAPRGPECGAREQSAAVPPPRARPRPRVHLRSSAARSGSPLPHSDGPSVQRAPGPGEAPGKREREGRGGQGRAGVAHTHSVRNSYGGDKAHGMLACLHTATQALSGGRASSYGCELARGLAPGRVPFLSFFIPAARTRAEPEPDLPRTPAQPKRRALFSTC